MKQFGVLKQCAVGVSVLLFLLPQSLGLAGTQDSSSHEDRRARAERLMEARFHLQGSFDENLDTLVPLEDLGLPDALATRFDPNGDGKVSFSEFEALSIQPTPSGSAAEPRDRSEFTHLREGGFPLNVDPEIVSAEGARIQDEDIVMGVVIQGEARAYPVNYMNGPYNEVVNDELGGQAIAPSW